MRGSKICFKCQKELPRSQFYKHKKMGDGLLGKCKECTKVDVSINFRSHLEYYRAYDKQRNALSSRKKLRIKTAKKMHILTPYKAPARSKVYRAVKNGVITKLPCQMCGSRNFIHAHHDDYSKPLEVMWLCPIHHKARHAFLTYMEQS